MMNKLFIASLLVSAINAQYNLTYLHLMGEMEPTLTLMASDSTATTYEKICPETTTTTPASSPTDDPWFGMIRRPFCHKTCRLPLPEQQRPMSPQYPPHTQASCLPLCHSIRPLYQSRHQSLNPQAAFPSLCFKAPRHGSSTRLSQVWRLRTVPAVGLALSLRFQSHATPRLLVRNIPSLVVAQLSSPNRS
jgi:hypothetical protein